MELESKPKRSQEPRLTIRISAQLHKRLKRVAVERETSMQALLTPAIESVANQSN